MTVRGRLAQLPKSASKQSKEIIKLYYEQGVRQKDIKEKLGLDSVAVVAEVLRRDMLVRVEKFKKLDPNSQGYQEKAVEIIKFLKNYRKLDYSSIGVILELPRETVFKIISDETSGLRNTLTVTEREDRNNEMLRLSQEEGLSVTEIGKRMGLSKQMVSRIFTDMGYKPIRGTRKVQITQKSIPDFNKIMQADCNARLAELRDELRKVKSEAASARQAQQRISLELRCKLIQQICAHYESESAHELKIQTGYIKKVYDSFVTTKARPPFLDMLESTLKIAQEVTV